MSVINHKIMDDDWKQSDIQEFMDKWGGNTLLILIWYLVVTLKNKKLNWHKSLGELFFNMPNFEI